MKKKYLLTVAIPTYSRSEVLRQRLDELAREGSHFAILVADDASIDETENIVKMYQKKLDNLFYIKHKKNIGYSRNVSSLYKHAPSTYIWFLCDDDGVIKNSINVIEKALNKYEPELAIFNCISTNPYGQKIVGGVSQDHYYTHLNEVNDYGLFMRAAFLSVLVFKKENILSSFREEDFGNTVFFQITLAVILLSKNFKVVEVAETIAERNVGYKYGEFYKFNVVDHLKAIHAVDHALNNDMFREWSIRQLPTVFLLYLSQKLGIYNFNGKPTKETLRYMKQYYGNYSYLIRLFPLVSLITPTILLKVIYFLRLVQLYGVKQAKQVYRKNINRSSRDERNTTFESYR